MIARPPQPLEQPPGVHILALRGDEGVRPPAQAQNAAAVLGGREVRPLAQADAVADQPPPA